MPESGINYSYDYMQLFAVKCFQKRFGLRKYQISTGLNGSNPNRFGSKGRILGWFEIRSTNMSRRRTF